MFSGLAAGFDWLPTLQAIISVNYKNEWQGAKGITHNSGILAIMFKKESKDRGSK